MPTNIVLTLDKRRKRKDNTYPIILRLSHNRKTTSISLGYYILEKYWDETKRIVKSTYKGTQSIKRLNNYFYKKRTEALDLITKLEESGELNRISLVQLKERILNTTQKKSFFNYTEKLIDDLKKANRFGTARSYNDTLKMIKRYNSEKDFSLEELNYEFLQKLENKFLSVGNSLNGLAVYMRTIRAIYNKAKKEGYITEEFYPFKNYKIKTTTTQKRALTLESLVKIKELELAENHICFHARNYFLVSFYMMGISFIDMAFLRLSNIVGERVLYTRRKTHKPYSIKISDALGDILSHYIVNKEKDDFIFPILKPDSLENQYKTLKESRKRYNKKLKKIAELAGIDEKLTSYVSRHTFASLANNKGIPVSAISEMLGHKNLKTTQIYLNSLSNSILDNYNDIIIDI